MKVDKNLKNKQTLIDIAGDNGVSFKELSQKVKVGVKYDNNKPPMSLLPPEALEEIAKVLDFGAKKYGTYNWRNGMEWTRVSSACLRHIFAWIRGEDLDPESGLHHLAHAGCCIMFLLTYVKTSTGKDDRYE
jgi:hypothetical protein